MDQVHVLDSRANTEISATKLTVSNNESKLVTINPLLHREATDIFELVLIGVKQYYEMLKYHLEDRLEAKMPDFSASKIREHLLTIRDYVLHGKRPDGWFGDDLSCSVEESVVHSLYSVFKANLENLNYRHAELTTAERYFCCFVLSAWSRFRIDAGWLGEFTNENFDDVDDVYYTQADLASLIGVTCVQFGRLVEKFDTWLDDPNVISVLTDENGDRLIDCINRIAKPSHVITGSSSSRLPISAVIEIHWKEKFRRTFSLDDFRDSPEEIPYAYSVLSQYKELAGYSMYRNKHTKIKNVYPRKNALCLLNLLAVKGYYTPTH